jgi:hypothetical protein
LGPLQRVLAETYHELITARPKGSVVLCSEVESLVFPASDPSDETGRVEATDQGGSKAGESDTALGAQAGESAVQEMKNKMEPSQAREETRRTARRLVNFGWQSQGVQEDRPVEAVQKGKVVEGSFAKGEWGIRWAVL